MKGDSLMVSSDLSAATSSALATLFIVSALVTGLALREHILSESTSTNPPNRL
jgi:hypothetical protein